MANWEIISVDTDAFEPGAFYLIASNRDNATLGLKMPLTGSILYTTNLSDDFSITNGIVSIKKDLYKFDENQFEIIDGIVKIKKNDNVVINFSPILNNNDCGSCEENKNSIISKNFIQNTIINIGPPNSDAVFLDYVLKNGNGKIEAGRIVIINEGIELIPKIINPEQTANGSIMPVTYKVSKDSLGIYLSIESQNQDSYVFKYKFLNF